MNMRRFLAAMLAVVMLIAMVPAKAQAAEDLEHMFPTIVTESTSTSMDSVYLTEGSILRDIMSDARRMTRFRSGNGAALLLPFFTFCCIM